MSRYGASTTSSGSPVGNFRQSLSTRRSSSSSKANETAFVSLNPSDRA